ncbi:PTS fructose transporter subunit IIB [Natranaeroarchaeum aerophilus]|uniref:Fructose PTS transporter subunit IIB n=1 Tax=Natranaeroarchaeum aerophilus TaxID=2917711 RepID=A0AAE3FRA8_9EURY|nr:PTS fructose transporter subunit IIB [Natranaeroarchaeum aerophilus]MCL9814207.1 fructose PTS transporter subunit IIB [Natranaeroarchaeum aerophilus]
MKFVAVTACPTGIAHSQMGAENLENTATKRGHEIDVEVQGAMGTENELSAEAIEAADAVIIAADTSVSQDRFEGKPLVKSNIKGAVNDADGLIDEAIEKAGGDIGGETEEQIDESTAEDSEDPDTEDHEEPTPETSESDQTAVDDSSDREKSGGLLGKLKSIFS